MYKKYFDNKQAVIFDLDGTVVDTDPIWKHAFEAVFKAIEASWGSYDEINSTGADVSSIWDYILNHKEFDVKTKFKIAELTDHTHTEFIKHLATIQTLEPTAGFWETAFDLKQKNLRLALNTNTDKIVAQHVLAKLGINQTFEIYTFGDEAKKKKPHPDLYLLTLQKLGIAAQDAVVFEDSVAGATASVKAKIETIVIWNGNTRKALYPNEIALFTRDFEGFPGNIDKTYEELLKMKTPRA